MSEYPRPSDVSHDVVNVKSRLAALELKSIRTMRGVINSNGTTAAGSGFTSSQLGTGHYRIAYHMDFADPPIPVATALISGALPMWICHITSLTADAFEVRIFDVNGSLSDTPFTFIAVSPS